MEVRENLAVIYAAITQRLHLAADELEQMIAQPSQPARLSCIGSTCWPTFKSGQGHH